MGNFLEDFLFGTPDSQTGETRGGVPAVADWLWPFENTWVSDVVDTAGRSTVGQVLTAPVRAGAQTVLGGLTALELAESYLLARPASTLLQASATSRYNVNPLYRDGIQFQDFIDMWNASEYISPARALVQRQLAQQAPVEAGPGASEEAANLYRAISQPYPQVGGVSQQDYEEAWDNSPMGTVVSGTYDLAFLLLAGGKGVNAAASTAKKAAGLATKVDDLRKLDKLRGSFDSHRVYRESSGAEGRFSVPGKLLEDLVEETDVARIRSSPLLSNWTRPSSFNVDELATLISKTDNEDMIAELLLADRGDALALGRLFNTAPDTVWSLSHMNDKLAREFAIGGQFRPSPQQARVIQATFDSAIERDDFFRTVRDMFMTGKLDDPVDIGTDVVSKIDGIPLTSVRGQRLADLNGQLDVAKARLADADSAVARGLPEGARASEDAAAEVRRIQSEIDAVKRQAPARDEFDIPNVPEPGKLNAVRGTGADFVPIGTEGYAPVANAAGMAQRWMRRTIADARINRPNTYVEVPLGARNSGPLTTLLFWAGSRQPLNMVSYNRLRPDEVVEEMLAYSRSSRVLRNKNWTVTKTDATTGVSENVPMAAWQWRADAIARVTAAKTQGDNALDATVEELQKELTSVVVNRYEVPIEDSVKIVDGLQEQVNLSSAEVARDGYFMDGPVRYIVDPVTMRQLPDSRMLMPLDDLDWALRSVSVTPYAVRGRGTRRVFRGGAASLDLIFKWFRTSILFRPGYTPKNSFAEPGISEFLADGSLLPTDGLRSALKRFDANNERRLLQFKFAVADRIPLSPARRDAAEAKRIFDSYLQKSRQLDELQAYVDDLDSAGTSPAVRRAYLDLAKEERKIVYRQVKDLEKQLDLVDDAWTQVDEIPTYSELSNRVANLRTALAEPDFVKYATRRIDELRDLAVARQSGTRDLASTLEEIKRLRKRRESLVATKDSTFKRPGRMAAERDLRDPNKNKRRDLIDPENPDARVAPSDVERLARNMDPRDLTRLRREGGRGDYERRIEGFIRSIAYIDEQIADAEATVRMLSKKKVTQSGLTPIEQAELDRLSALIFARSKVDVGDIDAQTVLDDLTAKLDDVREQTFVLSPNAKKEMQRLRDEIAVLDGERASLSQRIASRQLAREKLGERELSGEIDYDMVVGGVTYKIPAPFSTTGNYGTALRAEAAADLTAAQTMTGGRLNGAASGLRWRKSELGEAIMPFDPRYWDELTYVINRHVTGDDFANLLLSGKSDMQILKWFQSPAGKKYMEQMGWNYDQLRGGPKGSVPATPLGRERMTEARITMFEDGIIAETRRLLNQYFPDPAFRARLVESREWTPGEVQAALGSIEGLAPIYGTGLQFVGNRAARVNAAVNNGLNSVWRNLAVKPESRFARFPFFTREYRRQMEREIRIAQDRGQIVDGAALQVMKSTADARALKEMENTFYNVRRMTSPVFAMRYITAFAAAAWNTAYRYFRLAYRNPGRATIMANAWMNVLEALGTDEQGNEVQSWKDAQYVVLSFPDEWNVPIDPNLKIDANSINLGTQESGYLPTLSVPVSMILREKPDLEKSIRDNFPEIWDTMFGYGSGTDPNYDILGVPLDPFMGSYQKKAVLLARNVPEVGGVPNPFFQEIPDEDWARVVIQDYDYQMYQWAKDGQQGPMPKIEQSYENAKDYYIAGTLSSWMSPGAVMMSPEGQWARDEWYKIRSSFPNNYPAAIAQARLMYGPEFFFMMQSTSENRAGMPPTQDAYEIWKNNQDVLADLREIDPEDPNMVTKLMFLDEQTYNEAELSEVVYNWQETAYIPGDVTPVRTRPTPQEREDEYRKSRSWAVWNDSVAKLDALKLQYGYKTLSPDNETAWLYNQWNQFETEFRADPENALWKADKDRFDIGRTERALDGIDYLLRSRKFMSTVGRSQTWQTVRAYRLELNNARTYFEAAQTPAEREQIAYEWDEYVRNTYLPQAGNWAGYYERYLAGRDLSGQQLLDRPLTVGSGFPLPNTVGVPNE